MKKYLLTLLCFFAFVGVLDAHGTDSAPAEPESEEDQASHEGQSDPSDSTGGIVMVAKPVSQTASAPASSQAPAYSPPQPSTYTAPPPQQQALPPRPLYPPPPPPETKPPSPFEHFYDLMKNLFSIRRRE